jgi:hypothetical protein
VETENVTVSATLPFHAALMPTRKKTTAKVIALVETAVMKRALQSAPQQRCVDARVST